MSCNQSLACLEDLQHSTGQIWTVWKIMKRYPQRIPWWLVLTNCVLRTPDGRNPKFFAGVKGCDSWWRSICMLFWETKHVRNDGMVIWSSKKGGWKCPRTQIHSAPFGPSFKVVTKPIVPRLIHTCHLGKRWKLRNSLSSFSGWILTLEIHL